MALEESRQAGSEGCIRFAKRLETEKWRSRLKVLEKGPIR